MYYSNLVTKRLRLYCYDHHALAWPRDNNNKKTTLYAKDAHNLKWHSQSSNSFHFSIFFLLKFLHEHIELWQLELDVLTDLQKHTMSFSTDKDHTINSASLSMQFLTQTD